MVIVFQSSRPKLQFLRHQSWCLEATCKHRRHVGWSNLLDMLILVAFGCVPDWVMSSTFYGKRRRERKTDSGFGLAKRHSPDDWKIPRPPPPCTGCALTLAVLEKRVWLGLRPSICFSCQRLAIPRGSRPPECWYLRQMKSFAQVTRCARLLYHSPCAHVACSVTHSIAERLHESQGVLDRSITRPASVPCSSRRSQIPVALVQVSGHMHPNSQMWST